MKNKLLKNLWHYQNGFTEKTICHPQMYRNQDYINEFKDSLSFNRPVNPQGFRSHYDYENLPDDTFKIGFFGCSFTEGIGLCEDHIWINMFLEEFKKKHNKNAIALNFGKGGCSNDYITWNIEKAFEEVDLDLVCVQFTQIIRRTFAKPDESIQKKLPGWLRDLPFVNVIFSDLWGPVKNKHISTKDFNILKDWMCSDENNALNTINNIKLCKSFLKEKKIPFVLNKISDKKYDCSDFEYNAGCGILKEADTIMEENDKINPAYSRALDYKPKEGGHPGFLYHKNLAETYLKQYEEIIRPA